MLTTGLEGNQPGTTVLRPDLRGIAEMIGGPDADEIVRQLLDAHRSGGAAVRSGRVNIPGALDWISTSNDMSRGYPGAPWLVRKRLLDIPRILCDPPLPLFPPPTIRSPNHWTMLGACRDSCRWIAVHAETDPTGEFPFLPAAEYLDTETVLAIAGTKYASLARARRVDPDLVASLAKFRGEYYYRRRPLMAWVCRGRFDRED